MKYKKIDNTFITEINIILLKIWSLTVDRFTNNKSFNYTETLKFTNGTQQSVHTLGEN